MKLYILRHGRTAWNREGRLQGRTDIPLSEEGRESARETGEEWREIPFDAAFSSPLLRARETAELILQGRGVPVQTDPRLIELNFGAAEGRRLKELPEEERPTRLLFAAPERYVPPAGGETYDALVCRCRAFLEERILPNEGRWEHVLIVSHGAAVRGLFSAMFGAASDAICGGRVQKNCAVNVIVLEDGVFLPEHIAGEFCEYV